VTPLATADGLESHPLAGSRWSTPALPCLGRLAVDIAVSAERFVRGIAGSIVPELFVE
jgi:hypothetical protein